MSQSKTQKIKKLNIVVIILAILLLGVLVFLFFKLGLHKGRVEKVGEVATTTVATSTNATTTATTTDILIKESNSFYSIEAKYPVDPLDKSGIMPATVKSIVNEKKEEWKIGGEIWKEEQKIQREFPDRLTTTYDLGIAYKKTEAKSRGMISYAFEIYEYTGGAHGGTSLQTFTFNDKGQVNLSDILDLKNGKDISLTKILAKKLKTLLGAGMGEGVDMGLGLYYLKSDGTLDTSSCAPNCNISFPANFKNFLVTDTGIKFIMDQYTVAPYAAGMPEAVITWAELAPYLK